LAACSADRNYGADLKVPHQKEALANALRCLEAIHGDDYRTALTRIWVAENLAYLGNQDQSVGILRGSGSHYLISYGCVETAMVLLGYGQDHAVRQTISLGLDFLPQTVGRGAELVQFQLLKMATVVGDNEGVQRAWAAQPLTQVDLKPAYLSFVQDWKPSLWNRLLNWLDPARHWPSLKKGSSRGVEIAWNAERAVDVFTALLFLKEAVSRIRRQESFPEHWIVFARAGAKSAAFNTRPAAIQAELAELEFLKGNTAEALELVSQAGKMLQPWAPQMTGVYKIERDLALVLASLPDSGRVRGEFIHRLTKRLESLMGKTLAPSEQMISLPLLAEAFHVLKEDSAARATWKKAAELCAQNQNPETQAIGLTRIWMSYARANSLPTPETKALLGQIEKKLPEEYAKVHF